MILYLSMSFVVLWYLIHITTRCGYAVGRSGWTVLKSTTDVTERNKWYILTHLGESGYCLQINLNYQVNWPNCCKFSGQDPDLCEIRGDENHNLPLSLLLNLLYYTIEKCQFKSQLWHCVFMEICLIFYSYYIVTRGYIYIYTHHVGYVCSVRISIVL